MKCTGHSSRTGKPCKKDAIKGGTVCWDHGGAAPQTQAAAQRRLDHAAAAREVRDLGLTALGEVEELDPRDVLAEGLWRARATERLLAALVDELHLGEGGIYVDLKTVTQKGEAVYNGDAKPHVLWVMWQDAAKRVEQVANSAHRAGLEVRRQELAEQTARIIVDVLKATLSDPELDLTAQQQKAGQSVAARHLRLAS